MNNDSFFKGQIVYIRPHKGCVVQRGTIRSISLYKTFIEVVNEFNVVYWPEIDEIDVIPDKLVTDAKSEIEKRYKDSIDSYKRFMSDLDKLISES